MFFKNAIGKNISNLVSAFFINIQGTNRQFGVAKHIQYSHHYAVSKMHETICRQEFNTPKQQNGSDILWSCVSRNIKR